MKYIDNFDSTHCFSSPVFSCLRVSFSLTEGSRHVRSNAYRTAEPHYFDAAVSDHATDLPLAKV